jgi:hypothetical protein
LEKLAAAAKASEKREHLLCSLMQTWNVLCCCFRKSPYDMGKMRKAFLLETQDDGISSSSTSPFSFVVILRKIRINYHGANGR